MNFEHLQCGITGRWAKLWPVNMSSSLPWHHSIQVWDEKCFSNISGSCYVSTPPAPQFPRSPLLFQLSVLLLLLLLLISLCLMFIPDNQEHILSSWLTAPGWLEKSQRKVSLASSAGHAQGSGHDVLAQLLSFGMGTAIVFCFFVFFFKQVRCCTLFSLWTKAKVCFTTSNCSTQVPFTFWRVM